jgi:site-specific DNA recombinase
MHHPISAVIYSRYSSDRQSERSIEDQLELCRRLIEREGWALTRTYEDRAISGVVRQRPAFQQLLADAEHGAFDVVVAESLDRLGRKLADVADLYDRLSFRGIRIVTHAAGEVTQLHIGMLGTMAQLYLSELREKTRRGLMPRAAGKGVDAVLYGDLARILQLCEAAEEKSGTRKRKLPGQGGPGSQLSVVAGAGYHLCRTAVRSS